MYRLFNGNIACDFPLAGIPEIESTEADIRVCLGTKKLDEAGYDWFHAWLEDNDELILACARRVEQGGKPEYLLRFPDLADFEIRAETVTCFPGTECRDDSLRHLLLDQVIPRVWAGLGHLVIHASAVQVINGRVIAFTGESGWGKSTLAGALAEQGHRLLGDDCLCLQSRDGRVELIPSYTGIRLNADSIAELDMADRDWASVSHYSDKRRFEPDNNQHPEPLYLHTLYMMEEPSDVGALSIGTTSGAELITTLIKRSFLLDINDKRCAARQMSEASAILRTVPKVCTLTYPRDYQQLPAVCEALSKEYDQ